MHRIGVVGISWRHGTADTIASFTIAKGERAECVPRLAAVIGVPELVYLATCNRVEVVFSSDGHTPLPRAAPAHLRRTHGPRAARRRGRAHAARVAGRRRGRASLPRRRRPRVGARGRERDRGPGARGGGRVPAARAARTAPRCALHRGAAGGEEGAARDGRTDRPRIARAGRGAVCPRAPGTHAGPRRARRRVADDRAVRARARGGRHRRRHREPHARARAVARERGAG